MALSPPTRGSRYVHWYLGFMRISLHTHQGCEYKVLCRVSKVDLSRHCCIFMFGGLVVNSLSNAHTSQPTNRPTQTIKSHICSSQEFLQNHPLSHTIKLQGQASCYVRMQEIGKRERKDGL